MKGGIEGMIIQTCLCWVRGWLYGGCQQHLLNVGVLARNSLQQSFNRFLLPPGSFSDLPGLQGHILQPRELWGFLWFQSGAATIKTTPDRRPPTIALHESHLDRHKVVTFASIADSHSVFGQGGRSTLFSFRCVPVVCRRSGIRGACFSHGYLTPYPCLIIVFHPGVGSEFAPSRQTRRHTCSRHPPWAVLGFPRHTLSELRR